MGTKPHCTRRTRPHDHQHHTPTVAAGRAQASAKKAPPRISISKAKGRSLSPQQRGSMKKSSSWIRHAQEEERAKKERKRKNEEELEGQWQAAGLSAWDDNAASIDPGGHPSRPRPISRSQDDVRTGLLPSEQRP